MSGLRRKALIGWITHTHTGNSYNNSFLLSCFVISGENVTNSLKCKTPGAEVWTCCSERMNCDKHALTQDQSLRLVTRLMPLYLFFLLNYSFDEQISLMSLNKVLKLQHLHHWIKQTNTNTTQVHLLFCCHIISTEHFNTMWCVSDVRLGELSSKYFEEQLQKKRRLTQFAFAHGSDPADLTWRDVRLLWSETYRGSVIMSRMLLTPALSQSAASCLFSTQRKLWWKNFKAVSCCVDAIRWQVDFWLHNTGNVKKKKKSCCYCCSPTWYTENKKSRRQVSTVNLHKSQ